MYAHLFRQQIATLPGRVAQWIATHIAAATLLLIVALVAGVSLALRERGRGHLSRLRSELKTQQPVEPPPPPRPGGQEAIVLQRSQMAGSTMPEFLSATLLPGRGMNTLQITAFLPDKGEVELLASPTVEEAAKLLGGAPQEGVGAAEGPAGAQSLELGGAIELPWAGTLAAGRSTEKNAVLQTWHTHAFTLPVSSSADGAAVADAGLLLGRGAAAVSSNVMPDGGEAKASYTAGNFDGRWLSKTDVTITVLLSGRAVEIRVAARNTGAEPEPIGIGWRPRFAVLSGDRSQVLLHLPASEHIESRPISGMPSGRLLPVVGTPLDFTPHDGVALRSLRLNDTFVHLRPALLDLGPMVELRDPKSNYGLRITAMTPSIRAVRIESAPGSNVIVIDPRFNFDDPFGREWTPGEDTGMVTLDPGKTAQWRIRLELFPLVRPLAPTM